MNVERFQFIWWGWDDMRFAFKRLDPKETMLALIYAWSLCVGPLEIRKWK
jgi:hypothetical protein